MMRDAFFKATILILALVIVVGGMAACQKEGPKQKKEFVRVVGDHFVIGNKPYRYIGANFWQGAWLGANIIPDGRKRLKRELDQMKKNGIVNLRIMASSEKSAVHRSVTPSFQDAPGVYNDTLLTGLDYLLSEMGKRHMHAIMVMNDFWTWSGGMAQYVNWSTGKPIPDPLKTGDWNGFMAYSASFYQDTVANRVYRKYLENIINRTNSITGTTYKDDPTIMAWELANEPRPDPNSIKDTTLLSYFYNWVNSTAELIHNLAPNQLVTTGSEGTAGTLLKKNIFVKEQQPASIDYITIHIWPKNWSWYKADSASTMFKPAVRKTFNYLDEHIAIAQKMNKPLVLEEFGLPRDNEKYSPSSPTTYRDKYYSLVFDTLATKAENGSPLVGANFWAWGGEGRAHTADYMWKAGTDFTGDPPQEPQGLNSVFNTDTTTLHIIRRVAKRIE